MNPYLQVMSLGTEEIKVKEKKMKKQENKMGNMVSKVTVITFMKKLLHSRFKKTWSFVEAPYRQFNCSLRRGACIFQEVHNRQEINNERHCYLHFHMAPYIQK